MLTVNAATPAAKVDEEQMQLQGNRTTFVITCSAVVLALQCKTVIDVFIRFIPSEEEEKA